MHIHSEISNISQLKELSKKTPLMGVVRLLLGKMVVNRDQKLEPIMEVIRRNRV